MADEYNGGDLGPESQFWGRATWCSQGVCIGAVSVTAPVCTSPQRWVDGRREGAASPGGVKSHSPVPSSPELPWHMHERGLARLSEVQMREGLYSPSEPPAAPLPESSNQLWGEGRGQAPLCLCWTFFRNKQSLVLNTKRLFYRHKWQANLGV